MNKEYVFLGRMQPKTRDYIKNLERENRMLEHNWNELKKYVQEQYLRADDESDYETAFLMIEDKMQSLEEGWNNDC